MRKREVLQALNRWIATLMCALLVLGCVPVPAFAEPVADQPVEAQPAEGADTPGDVVTDDEATGPVSEVGQADADDGASDAADSEDAQAHSGQQEVVGQTPAPMEGDDLAQVPVEAAGQTAPLASASSQPLAVAPAAAGSPALLASSSSIGDTRVYVSIQSSKDQGGYGASYRVSGPVSAGTVLWANLLNYSSDVAYPDDGTFSYQWYASSTSASSVSSYEPVEGATQQSLAVTSDLSGKYLAVRISYEGKDAYGPGLSGITTSWLPGPVLGEGQVQLYSVEISAPSTQVGTTLTAQAYAGSYSSKTPVDEGVTYTWLISDGNTYSATWTEVAGQTGPTLVVGEDLQGKYVRVKATAGVNTVEVSYSGAVGPFKQEGAVDLYSALLAPAGTTDGTYVYTVGDTVRALAREKGATGYIDPAMLDYQWQASDTRSSGYEDIAGATDETLVLDESYEGRFVRCVISARVGTSSYTTTATQKIGALGSVNVTQVTLDASGKVAPGTTVNATAKASGTDVTSSDRVSWQWYCGTTSSSVTTPIAGATSSSLEIDADLLGMYVRAAADGGFGETNSTAIGPVTPVGAVTLYKVEATGDARVGQTLSATAYKTATSQVSGTDVVTYQWQYATSFSTSDLSNVASLAFRDIPGATGATFTIPQSFVDENGQTVSLLGCYLRVRATSDGTVTSTYQKYSYYGSTSNKTVDPIGPVSLPGQYELSSVALSSSTQTMQAGSVVTPQAKVRTGTYSESDAPSDAILTYTWYVAESAAGPWTALTEGYDRTTGVLTLGDELVGRFVKVEASALSAPVASSYHQVTAQGSYDLLRVTTSPQLTSSSTTLFTGDAVTATVRANDVSGSSYGIVVTDEPGVSVQWYAGDSVDGPWEAIEGATSATLSIPAEVAGRYLRVVATSGESEVELASVSAVVDASSLEGAATRLSSLNWRPSPVYGTDENINALVEAKLAELGYEGVTVTTRSAVRASSCPDAASIGVSTDAGTNGDITYFLIDPDTISGYANYSTWRQLTMEFTLSRVGEADVTWSPSANVTIDWDEQAARELLAEKAEALQIGYSSGDDATSVTGKLTLPYKLDGKSWSSVTWASDSAAVSVSGYGWSDYTGTVVRGSSDKPVTLTATVGFSAYGTPSVTVTREFDVVVAADPEQVAQQTAALEAAVDRFSADSLTYLSGGGAVDPDSVVGDIQLPTTRTLGIDGKEYQVTYTASTDDVAVNGYAGYVTRPLAGQQPRTVDVTLTVTSKSNPDISATKTVTLTIEPLQADDLDAELALMADVQASYWEGISQGQPQDAVTGDLHGFQKAYRAEDGSVAFTYDYASTGAAPSGIVPVDLPGYDPMGPSDQGRLFSTSRPDVIANETLRVTQPAYNTQVRVSSLLVSEAFGGYYERYKDDPAVDAATLAKLQLLAGQDASAVATVLGTTGEDDPHAGETVAVTVQFKGPDATGAMSAWTAETQIALSAGQSAADATRALLDQLGISYRFGGSVLLAVTSPYTGQELANVTDGSYWHLYVDGSYSELYADRWYAREGMRVEWVYSADDHDAPAPAVTNEPLSTPLPSWSSEWPSFFFNGSVTDAALPTGEVRRAWDADLTAYRGRWRDVRASEPVLAGGYAFVAVNDTLVRIDLATGAADSLTAQLAGRIAPTARPVFTGGAILVPLMDGRLQCVNAQTMATRWVTAPTGEGEQSSTTLCLTGDGHVVLGTAIANADSYEGGTLLSVDVATGRVSSAEKGGQGWFWGGAASVGDLLLVGDAAGTLSAYRLVDGALELASSVDLGAAVVSDVVAWGDGAIVLTRDGYLHKVVPASGGGLAQTSVYVGDVGKAAPTVVGDVAFVGGATTDGTSALLAVVDLAAMRVTRMVSADDTGATLVIPAGQAALGGISAPVLVSTQGADTYAFFTVNAAQGVNGSWTSGGALYRYRLGDATAHLLFLPDGDLAQFCDSPVICDAQGNLYYLNDSGHLLELVGTDENEAGEKTDDAGGSDDGTTPSDSGKQSAGPADDSSGTPLAATSQGSGTLGRQGGAGMAGARPVTTHTAPAQAATTQAAPDQAAAATDGEAAPLASGAGETVGGEAPAHLPIWPFVGMAIGVCAIVVLLAPRRRDEEDEEQRVT